MALSTALSRRLGIRHPIMQAPMAGESATPELAAAASAAGALGSLGAPYMAPDKLRAAIRAIRAATAAPFNINLFLPTAWRSDPARMVAYAAEIAAAHQTLGLDPPQTPNQFEESFEAQLAVVLEEAPPVFSFTFGAPEAALVRQIQARGILVIGTATTVAEAETLAARGVDAVVAQGAEAGGHRGSFLKPFEQSLVGTMALLPQVVDAIAPLPVIAAGGIGDGRGVAAALCLGADLVSLGTSFLLAAECGIGRAYRQALQGPAARETALIRAYSGRPARGIPNAFSERLAAKAEAIPDFPVANAMSRAMRQGAARAGVADYISLWAGQAAPLAREEPAAAIVARVMAQAEATLAARATP